eukprot:364496-Chlamydomonas_euryale.AAC.17
MRSVGSPNARGNSACAVAARHAGPPYVASPPARHAARPLQGHARCQVRPLVAIIYKRRKLLLNVSVVACGNVVYRRARTGGRVPEQTQIRASLSYD